MLTDAMRWRPGQGMPLRRVGMATLAGLASSVAAGYYASQSLLATGAVAGGVLLLCLAVSGSPLLAVMALAGTYADLRLPLGPSSITLTDTILLAGLASAVLFLEPERRRALAPALGTVAIYLVVLLLFVFESLSAAAWIEWGHRGLVMAGGLMVGGYLYQRGVHEVALKVFVLVSGIIALIAFFDFAYTHLPAYPLRLSKNYVGSLLITALFGLLVIEVRTRSDRVLRVIAAAVLLLGMIGVQSRGAMMGLAIGGVVYSFASKRFRGMAVAVALAALPVAYLLFQQDLVAKPTFGPAATRILLANQALDAWGSSPVIGRGLQLFVNQNDVLGTDPHNVVLLTLAEGGVVGAALLIYLLGRILLMLYQRHTRMAAVALALLVARFSHGLFDVYWVHGSQTAPWIIIGMALAAPVLAAAREGAPTDNGLDYNESSRFAMTSARTAQSAARATP